MRILVVNPNTTAAMTDRIAAAARAVAGPGTVIDAVTPAMGPASIEGYYDEAFAVPGLLSEIAAGERRGCAAAVIACFDDTGLDAARSLATMPVVGLCEAAMALAGMLGSRFSVVTTLPRSLPPLRALAARYGAADRCRIRAAAVPVLALEDPNSGAVDRIRREIAAALAEDDAEAIVLGCAGMADLAARLAAEFGVPVIDGVGAAVKLAEALAGLGLKTSKIGGYAAPLAKPYSGLLAGFAPAATADGARP